MRGKWGTRLDKWSVRRLGFSVILGQVSLSRHVPLAPALLLETVGRRSGLAREVVLPYTPAGGRDMLVVGSNGGGPTDPLWVHNVRADPDVVVTVGRRRLRATARITTGDERDRLLALASERRPHVRAYDSGAASHERVMALVVLTPAGPGTVS
ncbi:hypothetical protein GCM10009836_25690 [Pseudonocardia ailaonensis]|uniref:Nitroreductase family deazaflavin-dependent oxidoreductase n=1 Tax=Pseudonocardia ailaonensis TaxID=367279 RepID=A0ABN2N0D2_9PSEU